MDAAEWARISPLEQARAKRRAKQGRPDAPPAPAAVKATEAHASATVEVKAPSPAVVAVEAATEAHEDVKPKAKEFRRIYEWTGSRWESVLREFPKAKVKGALSAAEKAAVELRAKNKAVREELGDHQTAAPIGRHRPGQDPRHAKANTRMRCKDDSNGTGQNLMRDGRAFARR